MDDFARNRSRTMSEGGFFAHSSGPYGENVVWWSDENGRHGTTSSRTDHFVLTLEA